MYAPQAVAGFPIKLEEKEPAQSFEHCADCGDIHIANKWVDWLWNSYSAEHSQECTKLPKLPLSRGPSGSRMGGRHDFERLWDLPSNSDSIGMSIMGYIYAPPISRLILVFSVLLHNQSAFG